MHFFARHRENIRQSSMSSRLLWPCLLLLTFGAALFLFASLHNTKKDISRSLQIQFSVFQNDMERYFDQLAVMGVNLSEDMSAEVDKELALRQMSFAQLNDSPKRFGLQYVLINGVNAFMMKIANDIPSG